MSSTRRHLSVAKLWHWWTAASTERNSWWCIMCLGRCLFYLIITGGIFGSALLEAQMIISGLIISQRLSWHSARPSWKRIKGTDLSNWSSPPFCVSCLINVQHCPIKLWTTFLYQYQYKLTPLTGNQRHGSVSGCKSLFIQSFIADREYCYNSNILIWWIKASIIWIKLSFWPK